MTTMPSYSVVIPTLGRPELIESIDSVLNQSCSPIEIIVVDNGPVGAEEASSLCEEIDNERLQIISLPPRSGPGPSRNFGAWQATGSYVAFLDDDDVWAPDYLSQVNDVIQQTHAEILFATRIFLDSNGKAVREKRASQHPPDQWLRILLNGYNPGVGGQNLVIKRTSFFELGGFSSEFTSGGDRALAIAALRAGLKFSVADDAIVFMHEPSGWRVTGHRRNTANDIRILAQNWHIMGWQARLRHVHAVYKRRRNDGRQVSGQG